MRADHVSIGLRVVVTGGKHRDSEGVVTWMAPRTNEYCEHFQKATVKLDSGEKVLVVPRWMEAA